MGRISEIVSDFDGKPLQVISPDLVTLEYKYDDKTKDLLEVKNLNTLRKKSQTYDVFGQVTSQTDFNNNTSYNIYAQTTGLLVEARAPNSVTVNVVYNANGLPISKTVYPNNASPLTTNYVYDSKGNKTRVTTPDGNFSDYTYDSAGNVLTATNYPNGIPSTTSYTYDLNNRLLSVKSPKAEITEYTYLPTGELIQIKDPKDKLTIFEYDRRGLLLRKTNPEGYVHQFTYDNLGNIISSVDPNGQTKVFEYNANNKLTKSILPDDVLQYSYDAKDQISEITNNSGNRIGYIRDQNDQLITEQNNWNTIGYTNNYSYDANGNRTSVKSTSNQFIAAIFNPDTSTQLNQIFYTYDANSRLTRITNYWGDQFDFSFDQANRLNSISRPGSTTSYIYNAGSQLTEISHDSNSIQKSFSKYVYDQRRYITQKETSITKANYSYDQNGQLTNVSELPNTSVNESFAYDEVGNRLSKGLFNYSYDNSQQRLQDDGQYIYLYDNNGNILAKNSKINGTSYHFEYSSTNQVRKILILNQPLGQAEKTILYQYDPAGRRILKSVTDNVSPVNSYTKKYAYDGENIIAEFDVNNRLVASFTHSPLSPDDVLSVHFTNHAVKSIQGGDAVSDAASISHASGNFYYLKDHLNSVTDVIDQSGNIIQKYDYSSFGVLRGLRNAAGQEVSFVNAAIKTAFTYTGREFEAETGLYYYRARYYDPSTGRFLQKDPDPGKLGDPRTFLSKYVYCGNNPIMNTDPNGKFFFVPVLIFLGQLIATSIVSGLIAGTVSGIISGALYHGSFWTGFAAGFAGGFVQGAIGGAIAFTGGAAAAALGASANIAQLVGGIVGGAYNGYSAYQATGNLGWAALAFTGGFASGMLSGGSGFNSAGQLGHSTGWFSASGRAYSTMLDFPSLDYGSTHPTQPHYRLNDDWYGDILDSDFSIRIIPIR